LLPLKSPPFLLSSKRTTFPSASPKRLDLTMKTGNLC
jgi:hypothetical protein